MTRDPVAELYAARARGRAPATLIVPVRAPFQSDTTYWLTLGQYLTLAWLRRRMRHHRGETTLLRIARETDASSPAVVSRRLDRLAQLSLIGRRSTRGRLGSTRFWPPRRARSLAEAARRRLVGNVVTSTPFGGYLSREGLVRALRGSTAAASRAGPTGSPAGQPAAGRGRPRRPPHLVWIRCPLDGAAVRLVRRELRVTPWRHHPGPARIRATWSGRCRRCNGLSIAPIDVAGIPPQRPSRLEPVGTSGPFRAAAGRYGVELPAPPEPAALEPPRPELVVAAAAVLDSGELASAELRERIRARYLPDRDPEAELVDRPGGPPAPRRDVLPILVASRPADTPRLVDVAARWLAGDVDLEALEAAGYGPGRAWWDVSRAGPAPLDSAPGGGFRAGSPSPTLAKARGGRRA